MNRPIRLPRNTIVVLMTLVVVLSVPVIVVSGLSATASAANETLVVDDDGEQCNAGFESINTAIQQAHAGTTIKVCAGTYSEQVVVDTPRLDLVADGHAVIETTGGTAVRVTAPQATIRGFDIRATQGADYAVEVGGAKTVVRNNTVESSGVGIFLSDGLTPQGDQSDLHPATGSRVVGNSVTADGYRIWTDADETLVQDNTATDRLPPDVPNASVEFCGKYLRSCLRPTTTPAIVTSGNDTVVRSNTVQYTPGMYRRPSENGISAPAGIQIGASAYPPSEYHVAGGPDPADHNLSQRSVVTANTVSWASGPCIWVREGSDESVVGGNDVTECGSGIPVFANDTVVRDNTIVDIGSDEGGDGVAIVGHDALVTDNTIKRNSDGVTVGGSATVTENTIVNNKNNGVYFSWNISANWGAAGSGVVLNNTIAANGGSGVELPDRTLQKAPSIEIHYNTITNNGRFGVNVLDYLPTDGNWQAVNATYNDWGCRGPSGGLEDPVTGKIADGAGDQISPADDPGISNVHFDPYLTGAGCPA